MPTGPCPSLLAGLVGLEVTSKGITWMDELMLSNSQYFWYFPKCWSPGALLVQATSQRFFWKLHLSYFGRCLPGREFFFFFFFVLTQQVTL